MRGAHRHKWSPSASALPPRPSTFGRKYLTLVYENTYANTRNTRTQIQTKYIRSEISHTSIRKYLHKYKKYTHTNTDQVHSVGNISHKYKKILTQIQEIPTRKYKLSTFGRKYLTQRRQSIFGRKGHKYKPSKFRIRYRIQI